jgi:hypothetical protein
MKGAEIKGENKDPGDPDMVRREKNSSPGTPALLSLARLFLLFWSLSVCLSRVIFVSTYPFELTHRSIYPVTAVVMAAADLIFITFLHER